MPKGRGKSVNWQEAFRAIPFYAPYVARFPQRNWDTAEKEFGYLVSLYRDALEKKKDAWIMGDIAIAVCSLGQRVEDPGYQDRFLRQTEEKRKSFDNNRWVSNTYRDTASRELHLPYTYYRIAANAPNRLELLRRAKQEKWVARELIAAVKGEASKEVQEGDECACGCGVIISDPAPYELAGTEVLNAPLRFASIICLKRYVRGLPSGA